MRDWWNIKNQYLFGIFHHYCLSSSIFIIFTIIGFYHHQFNHHPFYFSLILSLSFIFTVHHHASSFTIHHSSYPSMACILIIIPNMLQHWMKGCPQDHYASDAAHHSSLNIHDRLINHHSSSFIMSSTISSSIIASFSHVVPKHFRYLKCMHSPIKAVCKAYIRENPPPK